jgi:hypothetical protein
MRSQQLPYKVIRDGAGAEFPINKKSKIYYSQRIVLPNCLLHIQLLSSYPSKADNQAITFTEQDANSILNDWFGFLQPSATAGSIAKRLNQDRMKQHSNQYRKCKDCGRLMKISVDEHHEPVVPKNALQLLTETGKKIPIGVE